MSATHQRPSEMTIEEAHAEYARMRNIRIPSTSDLRREADIARRIRDLAQQDFEASVLTAIDTRDAHLTGVGR